MADPPHPPPNGDSATTTNDGTIPFVPPDTQAAPKTPVKTSFASPFPFHDVDTDTLVGNARAFAKKQLTSTPRGRPTARNSLDSNVKEQKTLLEDELVQSIVARDSTFASSLYHHVASRKAIDEFLKKTKVFDSVQQRWKLPRSHENLMEKEMYAPLVRLLNAILQKFWKGRALRQAIDTNVTNLWHIEAVETEHYSRPDISIKAEGPSFQLPHRKTRGYVGFSNMATCFEVKIERQRQPLSKVLLQLAVYARQIFIQQPNRRFVRFLLITEQNFRLFHFDRSGVQYSEEMDLHHQETRHIFVRLVLGLSSPNEYELGLDTSVKWVIREGRKVDGTLAARSGDTPYKLASIEPLRSSFNIRGQSTTYWRVIDRKSGRMLLVKDSWRSEERVSERVYLEEAKDKELPGVVQMMTCEEKREETKHFRGFEDETEPPSQFYNRISTRIVMDCEGKLIQDFASPMQLVCALRDAIAAHRKLFEHDILHRNISAYTIALGKQAAEVGNRGILLGLDMAIRGKSTRKTTGDNGSSDDCAYWSIVMLLNADPDRKRIAHPVAHDHLDDLEAFAYVLGHIIYEFDAEGKRLTCDDDVQRWTCQGPSGSASIKEGFLRRKKLSNQAEKHWPAPCKDLLTNFGHFLKQFSDQKIEISSMPPKARARVERLQNILGGIDQHYNTVLQYFDTAIQDLQKEENKAPIPQTPAYSMISSSATNSPAASERTASQPSRSQGDLQNYQGSLKRIPEESPDDHPDAKREHYETPPSPTPMPRGRAARRARRQG